MDLVFVTFICMSREITTSVSNMANKPPKSGENVVEKLYRREVHFKTLSTYLFIIVISLKLKPDIASYLCVSTTKCI